LLWFSFFFGFFATKVSIVPVQLWLSEAFFYFEALVHLKKAFLVVIESLFWILTDFSALKIKKPNAEKRGDLKIKMRVAPQKVEKNATDNNKSGFTIPTGQSIGDFQTTTQKSKKPTAQASFSNNDKNFNGEEALLAECNAIFERIVIHAVCANWREWLKRITLIENYQKKK